MTDWVSGVPPPAIVPRYRVLIGQIFQESHGFTPLKTQLPAFIIETGQALIAANENADSVLGGLIRTGRTQAWELIPSIAARASPGGRVTDEAYAFIKQHFMAAAMQGGFDAIALCLHGCMQTESLDSAEDDLLKSLRAVVGSSLPIVAGFDLHGHANGGMLTHLNFASAYKTNPHADAGLTGQRVGMALAGIFNGSLQPAGCVASVPMLTGGNDETASGPLLELHRMAHARIAANADLLDASIFNVNPFVDGKAVGQTALVYAGNAHGLPAARALAEDLARGLWQARRVFCHSLPALETVLRAAPTSSCVVVGDFGDRVLAGGPGDSVYVLAQARKLGLGQHVIAPVTDPQTLRNCLMAGIGSTIDLKVGGYYTPHGASLLLRGVVNKIGDGNYRNRGTYMHGATLRMGPYAVFAGDGFTLLITQDPLMSQDPGCFLDCGIELAQANIIVAKSGYHFKLGFGSYGPCVCVATPGLTLYEPQAGHFKQARPLYPIDDFEFSATAADLPVFSQ